jgi:2-succinyl-6-hydroxy-2,4-cyclohexadiene-1-carboxylate synthase
VDRAQRAELALLLHGFTHTGASWQPVAARLEDRFRTLAPDLPGHGSASDRQPVDLAGVMENLTAVLPQRFVLAGYSMGGRLALHLALARPTAVAGLVLIGASPGLAEQAERAERRRADRELAAWIERSSIEEVALRWAQTPILAGLSPEVAERVHQDRLRSSPTGLARALRGLGAGALPSLWDRLEQLVMPVTLVVGERDRKFQHIAREMDRSIPAAEVVVVPGTGHAVHLEAPGQVAEIIAGAPEADRR